MKVSMSSIYHENPVTRWTHSWVHGRSYLWWSGEGCRYAGLVVVLADAHAENVTKKREMIVASFVGTESQAAHSQFEANER